MTLSGRAWSILGLFAALGLGGTWWWTSHPVRQGGHQVVQGGREVGGGSGGSAQEPDLAASGMGSSGLRTVPGSVPRRKPGVTTVPSSGSAGPPATDIQRVAPSSTAALAERVAEGHDGALRDLTQARQSLTEVRDRFIQAGGQFDEYGDPRMDPTGLDTQRRRELEDLRQQYLMWRTQVTTAQLRARQAEVVQDYVEDLGPAAAEMDEAELTRAALDQWQAQLQNLAPVADPGPDHALARGQPLVLDGSASYHRDPGKRIAAWQWDFDGRDGRWWASRSHPEPGEGAIGERVTIDGLPPGEYRMALRVLDDGGRGQASNPDPQLTDEQQFMVEVRP